jgi:hypothetical protein
MARIEADSESMTTTEDDHIAAIRDRLGAAFPGVPGQVIDDAIAVERARFENKKIRDFVPLLVERRARESLQNNRVHISEDVILDPVSAQ